MKNLVTALVLVFAVSVNAQSQQLTGCFGLNFGASKQAVKEMMRTKHPNATILKEESHIIIYEGDKWINKSVAAWVFGFTAENELHTASVNIDPLIEQNIFDVYDEVVESMSNKYGKGEELEDWKYPYTRADKKDYGVTALKVGKFEISTYWKFQSSDPNKPDAHNMIEIAPTTNIKLMVKYQSGILIDKFIEERDKKNQTEM